MKADEHSADLLKYSDPIAWQHLREREEAQKRQAKLAKLQDPEYIRMKREVEQAKHVAQADPTYQQQHASE